MTNYTLPAAEKIFHLVAPDVPEVRFELHPYSKKIFVIWRATEVAEPIFNHCTDERTARLIVDVWITGYKAGKLKEVFSQSQKRLKDL